MLDQLISLVEQHAGTAIVKNDAVPNQHNQAAIREVATQIFDGLQHQVSQGNFQNVMAMFQGNQSNLASNPIVSQIISKVVSSLSSKFGVSQQQAQNIANSLLPTVMNQFIQKTNNPNDSSFDLQDMMRNFTGNSSFDVGGILDSVTSGKAKDLLGGLGKMFG